MDKMLLVFGDDVDWDSYLKFHTQLNATPPKNIDYITTSYGRLESGELPEIKNEVIITFFFFPFNYWNRNIEHAHYSGIYGNSDFYKKFRLFWEDINRKVGSFYQGRVMHSINHPLLISTERDKELTKNIFLERGIDTSKQVFTRNYWEILKLLNDGKKLFLKVRYGSMGKGITYLEKGNWKTNFIFKNNKIVSRHSDHGWNFIDITNNLDFLKELLKQDIIIEEAIPPYLINERKFDLRIYVCFGKVLYVYGRSNTKDAVTTNISQGARGESAAFLKKIPMRTLNKAKKIAIRALDALGLNFAGVDVAIDGLSMRPYVIEVNAFPGFPKRKRFNLSKRILHEICKHDWGKTR